MKATKTELKQELGKLLRAAFQEPVIITAHGIDSHVLMTMEHYMELMLKLEAMEGKKERQAPVRQTPEQG
jgi:prevent-host-death family protein